MSGLQQRAFAYAHSHAVLAGLEAYAASSKEKEYIRPGYGFVDKPGSYEEFQEMLDLARQRDDTPRDKLYVETIKEFVGDSLADFKAALIAIEKASLKVISMSEPHYTYNSFMTAIEILEELMPEYEKDRRKLEAVIMAEHDMGYEDILQYTGLSRADVFQALADRERAQERNGK